MPALPTAGFVHQFCRFRPFIRSRRQSSSTSSPFRSLYATPVLALSCAPTIASTALMPARTPTSLPKSSKAWSFRLGRHPEPKADATHVVSKLAGTPGPIGIAIGIAPPFYVNYDEGTEGRLQVVRRREEACPPFIRNSTSPTPPRATPDSTSHPAIPPKSPSP